MPSGVRVVAATDPLVWFRYLQRDLALADAIGSSDGAAMSVGFARYGAGERNNWVMNYDEALVITHGRFAVESDDGTVEAGPGEVIYLSNGTRVTYRAVTDAELVYISYPHWYEATRQSDDAWRLDDFAELPASE